MRKVLILVLILVSSASLSLAQYSGGGIVISSAPDGSDCNLWDVVPGLCNYYVVHIQIPGSITCATGVRFAAPKPACLLSMYLSDNSIFSDTYGNSQTGVVVAYGSPQVLPVHVLTINYFCQALTAPCCDYSSNADPAAPSGKIEAVDCYNQLHDVFSICAVVNPDASCPCWASPVEESTWGQVKALYVE